MRSLFWKKISRVLSLFVVLCFLSSQFALIPARATASSYDELRSIEYRYYFRGDYEKAIVELRAFLSKAALERGEEIEAREYLAASLSLTRSGGEAIDEFLKILALDAAYGGPDPAVFQQPVVEAFQAAKDSYASAVLKRAPVVEKKGEAPTPAPGEEKKAFYKKWWFYAAVGVVALLAIGTATDKEESPGEDGQDNRGTIVVGVKIH